MPSFLWNPLVVFTITLFSSATILMMVQPMIGKMLLPKFGGTPQVWCTCMAFFQFVLMAGYAYAHGIGTRLSVRKQVIVHLAVVLIFPLLSFLIFPLGIAYRRLNPIGDENPTLWVLLLLVLLIGVPFFVVSTTAPLMQKWFSNTGHAAAKDPYFLYAASNLGSMVSLVLYIAVIEPLTTLPLQGISWMLGYGLLAAMTAMCGLNVLRGPIARAEARGESLTPPAPPPDQITEKAPPETHITEKAPDAGETDGDAGAAEHSNSNGAPDGEGETSEQKETAAAAAQLGEKPVAVKGAKRWRKKDKKADLSEAITRTPAAALKRAPARPIAEVETAGLTASKPSMWTILYWIMLAFVPSSLFIGATTYASTDIAAVPLLWIIPFGLYLLSFILVFSRLPNWVHQSMVLSLPVAILLLVFLIVSEISIQSFFGLPGIVWKLIFHMATLFIVCMVCHGELARNRPATKYLTLFYLCMSFGGLLGGSFNAFAAPVIFNTVTEYHLVMAIACMLLPALDFEQKSSLNRWIDNALAIGLGLAALYAVIRWTSAMMALGREGRVVDYSAYMRLPGVKPGLVNAVFIGAIVVGIIFYVAHSRKGSLGRLLDVALPLALFLLTLELLRRSPFENWNFTWLSNMFKVSDERIVVVFTVGLPVALCYGFAELPIRFGLGVGAILLAGAMHGGQGMAVDSDGRGYTQILKLDRSFFGTLKVEQRGLIFNNEKLASYHRLLHGTTLHGMQRVGSVEPLTYYHRTGPVGLAYQAMITGANDKAPVAFIGLGTGTMASYVNPGQTATFYEIDQAVIDIAENPDYFTYLKECKEKGGNYVFEIGDARLKLENAPDHKYRVIVVDAFSSDAIPVHLITKEAIQLYFNKVAEDGLVCIHISNRYLRLAPVLGNIMKELGLAGVRMYDGEADLGGDTWHGKNASDWVILARKPQYLRPLRLFDRLTSMNKTAYQMEMLAGMLQPFHVPILAGDGRWDDLEPKPQQALWTDDFSNILSIFRWE